MRLTSTSFADGEVIPGEYALCVPEPGGHVIFGPNKNPALAWSDLPSGTTSLVLICNDPDAPSRRDDVNQEDRTVPADLPRSDFTHWVLVDLSPGMDGIAAGEFSEGVTVKGKPGPMAPGGSRQGLNSYTQWFAGDDAMEGDYFGYDGPCPPWNDERGHRYVFTLYATDLERCPVEGAFDAAQVMKAIEGHVLGQASITGTYSLNPALKL
jgi:hypothetical protein